MMNGLQTLDTWSDYFGNPRDGDLGLLNAIQVGFHCAQQFSGGEGRLQEEERIRTVAGGLDRGGNDGDDSARPAWISDSRLPVMGGMRSISETIPQQLRRTQTKCGPRDTAQKDEVPKLRHRTLAISPVFPLLRTSTTTSGVNGPSFWDVAVSLPSQRSCSIFPLSGRNCPGTICQIMPCRHFYHAVTMSQF